MHAIAPLSSLNQVCMPTWHGPTSEFSHNSHPFTFFECFSWPWWHALSQAFCIRKFLASADIRQTQNRFGRRAVWSKSFFYTLHHQVAKQSRINAFAYDYPVHDFSIEAVKHKCHPDAYSIGSFQFQSIWASTISFAFLNCHCTFMLSGNQNLLTLSEQMPSFVTHYPIHPLLVNLATVDLYPRHFFC